MAAINDDNNEIEDLQEKIRQLKREKQCQKQVVVVAKVKTYQMVNFVTFFLGFSTPNTSSPGFSIPGARILFFSAIFLGFPFLNLSNLSHTLPSSATATGSSSSLFYFYSLFYFFPFSILRCSESGNIYYHDFYDHVYHTTPIFSSLMPVFRSIALLLGQDYAI